MRRSVQNHMFNTQSTLELHHQFVELCMTQRLDITPVHKIRFKQFLVQPTSTPSLQPRRATVAPSVTQSPLAHHHQWRTCFPKRPATRSGERFDSASFFASRLDLPPRSSRVVCIRLRGSEPGERCPERDSGLGEALR